MSNPFMAALGGRKNDNGFGQMIQDFQRFRASFHGDPKAEVEKLLQSGQMSQAQFEQLKQQANELQKILR